MSWRHRLDLSAYIEFDGVGDIFSLYCITSKGIFYIIRNLLLMRNRLVNVISGGYKL